MNKGKTIWQALASQTLSGKFTLLQHKICTLHTICMAHQPKNGGGHLHPVSKGKSQEYYEGNGAKNKGTFNDPPDKF